mmetsp:Transcript_45697/g.138860  ORF Transcript_45697/g.138860 Transcript_45697/m.138860 type:complete len:587 (-) Transcript_45697:204-1964(-)
MTPELEQLRAIFEERSTRELNAILARHNNNVAAAVEAIFDGETERFLASETRLEANMDGDHPLERTLRRTIPQQSPNNTDNEEEMREREEAAVRAALEASVSEAAVQDETAHEDTDDLPCHNKLECTLAENNSDNQRNWQWGIRRGGRQQSPDVVGKNEKVQEKQDANNEEKFRGEEDKALKVALEESMAPSDSGRLAIAGGTEAETMSDEALLTLLKDPAFLDNIDDDLGVAIQLQVRLDEEEKNQGLEYEHVSKEGSLSSDICGIDSRKSNPAIASREEVSSKSLTPKQLAATADSVKDRLKSIGAVFLKQVEEARERARLVEKLEAMNKDNEIEQSKLNEKKNTRNAGDEALMQPLREELNAYLTDHPVGSFEQWVMATNSESSHFNRENEIDESFFEEHSCYRKVWNENARNRGLSAKDFVRARRCCSQVKKPEDRMTSSTLEIGHQKENRGIVSGPQVGIETVRSPRDLGNSGEMSSCVAKSVTGREIESPTLKHQERSHDIILRSPLDREELSSQIETNAEHNFEQANRYCKHANQFAGVRIPIMGASPINRPELQRQSRRDLMDNDNNYDYDTIEYGYI